jgi:hypothetical protein
MWLTFNSEQSPQRHTNRELLTVEVLIGDQDHHPRLLQPVNQLQEQGGHQQPTAGPASALRDKKHNLCPSLSAKLECVLLLHHLQHSPSL